MNKTHFIQVIGGKYHCHNCKRQWDFGKLPDASEICHDTTAPITSSTPPCVDAVDINKKRRLKPKYKHTPRNR